MAEAPGSVLWLLDTDAAARTSLRREAQRRGIAPDRLVFAPRLPSSADHLARLRLADLLEHELRDVRGDVLRGWAKTEESAPPARIRITDDRGLAIEVLADAGFDALGLANNHGLDYGPLGLLDSVTAKRSSPVALVGISVASPR